MVTAAFMGLSLTQTKIKKKELTTHFPMFVKHCSDEFTSLRVFQLKELKAPHA